MSFFKQNGKYVELGGFGLALLGIFLPYITMSASNGSQSQSESASLMGTEDTWGYVTLALIILGLLAAAYFAFAYKNNNQNQGGLAVAKKFGTLGLAGAGLLVIVIYGIDVLGDAKDYINMYAASGVTASAHFGIGFYIMVLGFALVIVSGIANMGGNGAVAPVPQPYGMPGQPMNNGPMMNNGMNPNPALRPVNNGPAMNNGMNPNPALRPVNNGPAPMPGQPMNNGPMMNNSPMPGQPMNNGPMMNNNSMPGQPMNNGPMMNNNPMPGQPMNNGPMMNNNPMNNGQMMNNNPMQQPYNPNQNNQ